MDNRMLLKIPISSPAEKSDLKVYASSSSPGQPGKIRSLSIKQKKKVEN